MMKPKSKKLQFMLSQGEGYNLEFKASFSNSIHREICALANSNGGKILLGVNDEGEILGVKHSNTLKSQIQSTARNLDPPLVVGVNSLENVVVIDVPEGKEKPYSANGKFYMRHGSNTQQLKRDEIRKFFQDEGLILFDEKPNPHFNLEKDFNKERFEYFLERAKITPVLGRDEILKNLRLLDNNQLKNAGVLLFCGKITMFFMNATITCVLYMGKTKYKILDRKEFDDDLYSNFRNALDYLRAKLNTEFIIKGGPREEKLELPEDALREALLNAIGHRDYFVRGANILVEIFADRVEITNPGGLVRGMTPDDLGKRSLSRNELLFGIMQRMDLIEKVGSGILRMKRAMNEYGFDGPEFDINENWFTIVFKRSTPLLSIPAGGETEETREETEETRDEKWYERWYEKWYERWYEEGLTPREREIIIEIKRDNSISIQRLAELIGINMSAVQKQIENLRHKGVLERVGPARGGSWRIIDTDK